jgi:hypothetical protein
MRKEKKFQGISIGHQSGNNYNYIWIHKEFYQIRSKSEIKKFIRALKSAAKYMEKLAKNTGKLE